MSRTVQAAQPVAAPIVTLELSRLTGLVPLGNQIGIWPKQQVMEPLAEPLFGRDGAFAYRGSFAILDAAKLDNLPEVLASSGLHHRCLFKGTALENWGHVAPWLVALDPENRLTRRLFTAGEDNFGLWQKAAAMFVRTESQLDELWRHFRKFTRLEDETGQWVYFRFWEPVSLMLLYRSRALPGARAFFQPCPLVLAPQPQDDACLVLNRRVQADAQHADVTPIEAETAQSESGQTNAPHPDTHLPDAPRHAATKPGKAAPSHELAAQSSAVLPLRRAGLPQEDAP